VRAAYAEQYAALYNGHWWWRAREALVLDALRALPLRADGEVLDVGCGDALSFPILEQFGRVRGIEVDEDLLDADGPYRERVHSEPLGSSAYDDWRFDLITALDVIEHIEDDRAAAGHIARMLRPGGYLVLTVPAGPALWSSHDTNNHHYRRYRRAELRRLLDRDFTVVDLRFMFNALYLPKRAAAWIEKAGRRRHGEDHSLAQHQAFPRLLGAALRHYCVAEGRVARHLPVPFGSSLLAVAQRAP